MAVSDQIIQVIDALCEKFGIAMDWTGENVLPYVEALCKKLVTYKICVTAADVLIYILVIVGCVLAAKKLYPVFKDGIEEQGVCECGWTIAAVFSAIAVCTLILIMFISACCGIEDIVKCVTFPELYVFEFLKQYLQ